MTYDEIARLIASDIDDDIIEGLYVLGSRFDDGPSDDLLELALDHLTSDDEEIRNGVARAVGIHWAYRPSYGRLMDSVERESDAWVAKCSLMAISAITQANPALMNRTLSFFAEFGAAPKNVGLREFVQLESKLLKKEISIVEYARRNCGEE